MAWEIDTSEVYGTAELPAPVGTRQAVTLHAIADVVGGTVAIATHGTGRLEIGYSPFADFIDASTGLAWGTDAADTAAQLNTAFQTAPAAGVAPSYADDGTTYTVVDGDGFDNIAAFANTTEVEYTSLPAGLFVDPKNRRRVLGTPTGGVGLYSITADLKGPGDAGTPVAVTYSVNVIAPAWANTHSLRFFEFDYVDLPATTSNPLHRTADGTGASDAWTVSAWIKPGSNTSGQRGIVFFGSNSGNIEGVLVGYDAQRRRVVLTYGIKGQSSRVEVETANNSLTRSVWHHVMVCYDGGATASRPTAEAANRFAIYIDGVDETGSWSGNGWGNGLQSSAHHVGTYKPTQASAGLKSGHLVNRAAIWGADLRADVAEIYNAGVPLNLDSMPTVAAPYEWRRMGDYDTSSPPDPFPAVPDFGTGAEANGVAVNMTTADISSDVPT